MLMNVLSTLALLLASSLSVGSLFQPLEEVIYQHFIPVLTGCDPCRKLQRDLLSLPCRHGGVHIPIQQHS